MMSPLFLSKRMDFGFMPPGRSPGSRVRSDSLRARPAFPGACTEWLLGRAARLQWRDRGGIWTAFLLGLVGRHGGTASNFVGALAPVPTGRQAGRFRLVLIRAPDVRR